MSGIDLIADDGSQVQLLLRAVLEALAHHPGDKDGRHREQAVRAEGLDQEELVDSLTNSSCSWGGREGRTMGRKEGG